MMALNVCRLGAVLCTGQALLMRPAGEGAASVVPHRPPCYSRGERTFPGSWSLSTHTAPYRNLSCPLEMSNSCHHQGHAGKAQLAASYVFEPFNCELLPFDSHEFVHALNGRRLVIAGDSLQRQLYISLGCLTHDLVAHYHTEWSSDYPCHAVKNCITEGPHGGFGKADLTWRNGAGMQYKHLANIHAFLNALEQESEFLETDVIIVNFGVHVSCAKHEEVVRRMSKIMSDWTVGPLIIYLGSAAIHFHGSPDGFYPGPNATTPPGKKACVAGPVKPSCYVKNERSYLEGHMRFIDVFGLSSPLGMLKVGEGLLNGLGDCQHWCMPGVPDTYSNLLFNMLVNSALGK